MIMHDGLCVEGKKLEGFMCPTHNLTKISALGLITEKKDSRN
jgi:hypothetical protein